MSSKQVCPMCEMDDVLEHAAILECVTCGHEWEKGAAEEAADGPREVRDAHGNVLVDGDIVAMVKDIKLKGTSDVLKIGTKSKPIKIVDGDHEISCKMGGISIALKAMYVKKVS